MPRFPPPRLVVPGLLLLTVLVAGCDLQPIGVPASSPGDAARKQHGQQITILGSRVSGDRGLVLSQDSTTQNKGEFYADILQKQTWAWQVPLSISANGLASVPSSALGCIATVNGYDSRGNYSIVYGYVRTPDVAAVEVDFSNAQTLKDSTSDGIFAIIQPGAAPGTEIRFLNDKDEIVHTRSLVQSIPASQLAAPPAGKPPARQEAVTNPSCAP